MYNLEKGTLVNIALEEKAIPAEAVRIYNERPDLNCALLRAASKLSNNGLQKIINNFNKKRENDISE